MMKRTFAVCILLLLTLVHGVWGQSSAPPPTPIITSFDPASYPAGGSGFFLTVFGQLFQNASLRFTPPGGTTTPLTPSSGLCDSGGNCQITVFIPANLVTTSGTATVVVRNGDPTGTGLFRDSVPANYVLRPPTITSLSPSSASAGGPGFTLTINGADFV